MLLSPTGTLPSNSSGRYGSKRPIRPKPGDPLRSHGGLDLAMGTRKELVAPAPGRIAKTYESELGGGLTVEIAHPGLDTHLGGIVLTRHQHCAAFIRKQGDPVERAEPFAIIGETGNADGVHVHFELTVDQKAIDPYPFLEGGRYSVRGYQLGDIRRIHFSVVGPHARMAQLLLIFVGFEDIVPDGDFGEKSETAIRAFQKLRNLTADGIVGRETWTALLPRL